VKKACNNRRGFVFTAGRHFGWELNFTEIAGGDAPQADLMRDVRFGSEADIGHFPTYVSFGPSVDGSRLSRD
jgi:hypothetical protein